MKMYRTVGFGPYIDRYEVDRRTGKHVWFTDRQGKQIKEKIIGKYWRWHDSYRSARAHLLLEALEEIQMLKEEIKEMTGCLAYAKAVLPEIRKLRETKLKVVK